jgi:hypothetical protein
MKQLILIALFVTLGAPTSTQNRRPPARQEPPPAVRREIERITGKKYVEPAPYRGARWEYRVESRGQIITWGDASACGGSDLCLLQTGLTALGAKGWELVAIDPTTAYVFKRRK